MTVEDTEITILVQNTKAKDNNIAQQQTKKFKQKQHKTPATPREAEF